MTSSVAAGALRAWEITRRRSGRCLGGGGLLLVRGSLGRPGSTDTGAVAGAGKNTSVGGGTGPLKALWSRWPFARRTRRIPKILTTNH